jgi:hypothetical protein
MEITSKKEVFKVSKKIILKGSSTNDVSEKFTFSMVIKIKYCLLQAKILNICL